MTRQFLVTDAVTGSDLVISSAIVDGTGFASSGIGKTGLGDLELRGSQPNTFTGVTTVNDGSLILNKGAGVAAMSGPLVIGDGNVNGGGRNSDAVKLMSDNQLPDSQAGVTVNSTGLLDLNGHGDEIGTTDGQTALTVHSGTVSTGAGKLTVNGDIVLTSTVTAGGLPNSPAGAAAPTISGKLEFAGNVERRINVTDNAALLLDALISAAITNPLSNADIRTTGTGSIALTADNAMRSAVFIQNAPGANGPSVFLGSATALALAPSFRSPARAWAPMVGR